MVSCSLHHMTSPRMCLCVCTVPIEKGVCMGCPFIGKGAPVEAPSRIHVFSFAPVENRGAANSLSAFSGPVVVLRSSPDA